MKDSTHPIRIGNIYGPHRGTGFAGNVWDKEAVAPTITTCGGGNREPMVIEIEYEQQKTGEAPPK